MAFVQFSQVSLHFGDRTILNNVSVNLAAGTRAALTGANGSGKTTLMKVLCGTMQSDSGTRAVQKETVISYLPQSGLVHSGTTLLAEVDKAFFAGYALQAELEKIGTELENSSLSESKTNFLLEKHHDIQIKLEESLWHRRQALAEQTLTGLGFSAKDFERRVEEFSGGWQMRIALAKVLLERPDILLLDEPTNYLDIEARNWLEAWLKEYKGGFLLVSHDRYFLDVCVNEVYELFNGDLKRYVGNYTHYEKIRRVELESLIARYEIQQQEIQKLEDYVRRFRSKATKAVSAQEKLKILEKMERIEIPETLKKIHFSFPPAPHSGKLVLTLENISKTYPASSEFSTENKVLQDLNIVLEKGDRLVVAGKNGAGKSTLLRILSGEDTSFEGAIKTGSGVQIGYFSQDNAETLNGSESILETLESVAPLEMIPKLRDMLGAFLFRGDDVYKSVSVLSGGEKSRVALLQLLLRPVNLLILDEPTNHLDLHSKDVLLDALKSFGGTVLFVSHDRNFIESLATRVIELKSGTYREFPGNYEYYMERIEAEQANDLDRGTTTKEKSQERSSTNPTSTIDTNNQTEAALSWAEEKKAKNERRRLEREEERLLAEIEKIEEEKTALEEQLALPEVYTDGIKSTSVQKQISEKEALITTLSEQWEEISSQL